MRKCCICGADMHEGYLNENDDSTYCGAGCLSAHMTLYEFGRAYKAGTCFWTSWMDEPISIGDLDLSVRSYHALRIAGVTTIEQLRRLSDDELLNIKNFNSKCLAEIHEILKNTEVQP